MPAELYAETLGMFRFPRTLLAEDVMRCYAKYHDLKVDVVVAAGSIVRFRPALSCGNLAGRGNRFHSVPAASLEKRDLDPHTIGVPVRLEFGQTLDLALRLRPATRRVVVVAGIAEPDKGHLSVVRALLEHYVGKLEIQYLVGLTLAETIAAVGDLPRTQ